MALGLMGIGYWRLVTGYWQLAKDFSAKCKSAERIVPLHFALCTKKANNQQPTANSFATRLA
jgi:hypothetical protein